MTSSIRLRIVRLFLPLFIIAPVNKVFSQSGTKPNIVVILTDDQGYADFSFNPHHPTEVNTPNMDALANEGIYFSQAYTSGNTCSPTRAGLMTGRYQHRVGIYDSGEGGSGMPLDQVLFPQYLKPEGYVCGAFGKWHLGLTPEYNPISRGFDEFYGFMGRGAHDYYELDNLDDPLFRGLNKITDEGYLTNLLTEEAVDFIKRNKEQPFFCYLAYNAVHTPAQAPAEDVADFNTGDSIRNILMAMLRHLDNGVGEVVKTLKDEGLWENTLLFFLTDNGGSSAMSANNSPLRGFKQMNYEGGIRTPFVVTWPAKFQGGKSIETPIISLDILPTVLEAVGIEQDMDKPFDGKSIIPLLSGETKSQHEMLFWTEGGTEGEWAVRYGKWKLVAVKSQIELFDLETDPSEIVNLAVQYPDTLEHMVIAFENWLNEMEEPMQIPSKRWSPEISAGKVLTLYDGIYYKGENQSFNEMGIYNSANLSSVNNNQTRSILLAPGYDALAFSEDELSGEKFEITNSLPFLSSFDQKLSSMVVFPEGMLDRGSVDITASEEEESAQTVMDGDLSTYWDSKDDNEWIQFSLCAEQNLKGIKIAFKRGNMRVTYFDVEVSLDGVDWQKVISDGQSNGLQTPLELFSFSEVGAKYIRIVAQGNADNAQNHYTEVELVYGNANTNASRIEAEDYSQAQSVTKYISDDCQSLLAIDAIKDSYASYKITNTTEAIYIINIRLNAIQQGTVDIKANNSLLTTINIDETMVNAGWHTISKSVTLPQGDFPLSFHFKGNENGTLIKMNWFEFPGSTTISSESIINNNTTELKIYPNPCSTELHISSAYSMKKIRIIDCNGQIIMELANKGLSANIQTGRLNKGIYFIQISGREGIQQKKFIKY